MKKIFSLILVLGLLFNVNYSFAEKFVLNTNEKLEINTFYDQQKIATQKNINSKACLILLPFGKHYVTITQDKFTTIGFLNNSTTACNDKIVKMNKKIGKLLFTKLLNIALTTIAENEYIPFGNVLEQYYVELPKAIITKISSIVVKDKNDKKMYEDSGDGITVQGVYLYVNNLTSYKWEKPTDTTKKPEIELINRQIALAPYLISLYSCYSTQPEQKGMQQCLASFKTSILNNFVVNK